MDKRRNVRIMTVILMLNVALFGQSYSDDFEDGDPNGWEQYRAGEEMLQIVDMNSAPAVLPGGGDKVALIQDIDLSYTGAAIVLIGDEMDKDYIVEADVYVYENHSQGSAYTGIVAYGDSTEGYYVKLAADFDSSDRLRLYNNQLNPSTFSYTFHHSIDAATLDKTEGWHHMKIHVSTNPNDSTVSYHCWYDEVDLGTYIDDAEGHTLSGKPGFFAFQMDSSFPNPDGLAGYFDNFVVTPADWVAVKTEASRPVNMRLMQNYPNPFNPSTQISFDIRESGFVNLRVFNVTGEVVKTLASGDIRPGSYQLSWDGTSDTGQKVAAGNYVLVLSKGQEQLSRNMVLIK